MKWDLRYLELARQVASWSKDPSTQVGAVAVGSKGQVLSQGYNGFPRGVEDSKNRLESRDEKYKYVVHAEMNCVFNASYNGVSLDGSTMYVYGLPICHECAKGIIQCGVTRVVMPYQNVPEKWATSWKTSTEMFKEAGVKTEFINYE